VVGTKTYAIMYYGLNLTVEQAQIMSSKDDFSIIYIFSRIQSIAITCYYFIIKVEASTLPKSVLASFCKLPYQVISRYLLYRYSVFQNIFVVHYCYTILLWILYLYLEFLIWVHQKYNFVFIHQFKHVVFIEFHSHGWIRNSATQTLVLHCMVLSAAVYSL
jgi:hypothetical protein